MQGERLPVEIRLAKGKGDPPEFALLCMDDTGPVELRIRRGTR